MSHKMLQMQHDVDFKLVDAFEDFEIDDYVVGEPVQTGILQYLRFVRVPAIDLELDFPTEITCSVSEKGEYAGIKNYVAVSYCWDSFRTVNNAVGDPRRFKINERGKLRDLRCPPSVLHRAICYAIRRGVELLWIDQECIDQTDEDDVQAHLQCMHLIFGEAEHAVGLLSFEISTWTQFMALMKLCVLANTPEHARNFLRDSSLVEFMICLMKSVSRDRWFTRTWVYQERYSSFESLQLLCPLSDKVKARLQSSHGENLGEDIVADAQALSAVAAIWAATIHESFPSDSTQEWFEKIENLLRQLHHEVRKLSVVIRDTTFDELLQVIQSGKMPSERERHYGGFRLAKIFEDIELCDNRIVSDRVAIFANVADMKLRVKTTEHRSYSAALFFHLLENDCLPAILIRGSEKEKLTNVFHARHVSVEDILFEIMQGIQITRHFQSIECNQISHLPSHSQSLESVLDQELSPHTSAQSTIEGLISGELTMEDLPWMKRHLRSLSLIAIAPRTATIREIFHGIVAWENNASEGIDYDLGRSIVQYGIETGQLPSNIEFVAFFGRWRWHGQFIQKHFVAGV